MSASYKQTGTEHLIVADKAAIPTAHYVKTANISKVEKSERTESVYETLKSDGAGLAMFIAKQLYLDEELSVRSELAAEAAKMVAFIGGVSVDTVKSLSKRQPMATWRQAGMFAAIINGKSTTQAAKAFGRADHTTAIWAYTSLAKHVPDCPRSITAGRAWFADLMKSRSAA